MGGKHCSLVLRMVVIPRAFGSEVRLLRSSIYPTLRADTETVTMAYIP